MVHLWQHHFGKPGRRGYHNKQWAAKMHEVGLIPSRTGKPGGKQTGQAVTHYIDENGRFAKAWNRLVESGYRLDYQDRLALQPSDPKHDKVAMQCPAEQHSCVGQAQSGNILHRMPRAHGMTRMKMDTPNTSKATSGECSRCGEHSFLMPLHGGKGGFCVAALVGTWNAEHGRKRRLAASSSGQ